MLNHSIDITFVIYGLGGGGAERVMTILGNYAVQHGCGITIITLVGADKPPFYELDSRINLKQLGIAKDSNNLLEAFTNAIYNAKVLRASIIESKPDLIISFMNVVNVLTLIASRNLDIPRIVCKHIYPEFTTVNKVWKLLMKLTYRWADRVTVLTESALKFFPRERGYKSIVMPNPVLTPEPAVITTPLFPTPSLIAMGRLLPQKGFDLLIEAFAKIQGDYPDWHVTILGEGPLRGELEQLITDRGLSDRIHLPGMVTNVNDYLRQADLFVLSSRHEGFPMAVCEAMACGLPVLATDCPSGPSDIIRDGIDGVLVPVKDVDALANGLASLMGDPVRRQQLAAAAPEVLDRFGVEAVIGMWNDVIEQIFIERGRSDLLSQKIAKV